MQYQQGGDQTVVLARWSPFGRVSTVPGLFDGWTPFAAPVFRQPVNVRRTEDGYRVEAALPGFTPEDIEVTLDRGTLTISARRSDEKETEQGRYLRREAYFGSFQRRLALPAEVEAKDVRASYENGVLTVDVAYAPAGGAVRIPIGPAAQPAPDGQTEA
jgi:HSP20 family protein